MKRISVKKRLPKHGQYVLAHLTLTNWGEDKGQYYKVVQFIKGLSVIERQALTDENPKKKIYMEGDEYCNNHRGFEWKSFGPGCYFGQAVDYWYELPKEDENERLNK